MLRISFIMLLLICWSPLAAQGNRQRNRAGQNTPAAVQTARTGEIHGMVKDEHGTLLDGAQVTVNGFKLGGVSEYGHLKYFIHSHNLFDSYQDDLNVGMSRDAGYVYGPSRPRSFYTGISAGF